MERRGDMRGRGRGGPGRGGPGRGSRGGFGDRGAGGGFRGTSRGRGIGFRSRSEVGLGGYRFPREDRFAAAGVPYEGGEGRGRGAPRSRGGFISRQLTRGGFRGEGDSYGGGRIERGRGRGRGGDRGYPKRPSTDGPLHVGKRIRFDNPAYAGDANGYSGGNNYSGGYSAPNGGYASSYSYPSSGGYEGAPDYASGYSTAPPTEYHVDTYSKPKHYEDDYSAGYVTNEYSVHPPATGYERTYSSPATYDSTGYGYSDVPSDRMYGSSSGYGQSRDYSSQPRSRY